MDSVFDGSAHMTKRVKAEQKLDPINSKNRSELLQVGLVDPPGSGVQRDSEIMHVSFIANAVMGKRKQPAVEEP